MMNKGDISFGSISPLNQSFTHVMRDALKVGHLASSSTDSDNSEYNGNSLSPHKTPYGTTSKV
jgi:hypothetical protein